MQQDREPAEGRGNEGEAGGREESPGDGGSKIKERRKRNQSRGEGRRSEQKEEGLRGWDTGGRNYYVK